MAKQRVMVVGGGLGGLAAAMKLAELGIQVDLMSLVPVKRSHSVCAQGGINSVNDLTRQQGDNESKHFDDTVYGGDFLQHQPPVKEMTLWGPKIIELMDRLGVPFNRTPEGFIDRRRFGGTLYKRTAFAGATTGQQLLYALDEQVRRYESEGRVKKFEHWELRSVRPRPSLRLFGRFAEPNVFVGTHIVERAPLGAKWSQSWEIEKLICEDEWKQAMGNARPFQSDTYEDYITENSSRCPRVPHE